MPRVKDLTSELGKLPRREVCTAGMSPTLPRPEAAARKMAVDSLGLFLWSIILAAVCFQFGFLIWLS
jgi:hypothetical protein